MYFKRELLLFHNMLNQGMTWFTLASNNASEAAEDIKDILPEIACNLAANCNFLFGSLHAISQRTQMMCTSWSTP